MITHYLHRSSWGIDALLKDISMMTASNLTSNIHPCCPSISLDMVPLQTVTAFHSNESKGFPLVSIVCHYPTHCIYPELRGSVSLSVHLTCLRIFQAEGWCEPETLQLQDQYAVNRKGKEEMDGKGLDEKLIQDLQHD